jgi:hypothetical protein
VPVGFDGPPYQLNLICAHPLCLNRATERHHLWRRSLLGAPYSWVMLSDGTQVGNIVGFCSDHHAQITDEQRHALVRFEHHTFIWCSDSMEVLPLTFQPPWVLGEVEFENPGEKTRPKPNECPSCGQPLPHAKIERPREQKRQRRTWSITVPADHREQGAETLDTLLEEARLELDKAGLSYGGERSTRFFVLATILGLFVHHFDELVSE